MERLKTVVQGVLKLTNDLTGGILVIHELLPILLVAITEAYLKDVLIFAAGIDISLMERLEQTASYQDILNASSLEDLILLFRSRWARRFVDRGGPTRWINSLEAMGARSYRSDTAAQMEALWGVRHLVIHSAGIATAEFTRRHPNLKGEIGKRFIVNNAHLKQWLSAIHDFVEVTDRYFVQRCQKSQTSVSDDAGPAIAPI